MTSVKQMLLLSVLVGGGATIWVPDFRDKLPAFITGQSKASIASDSEAVDFSADEFILVEEGDGEAEKRPSVAKAAKPAELLSLLRNFQVSKPKAAPTDSVHAPKTVGGSSIAVIGSWQTRLQSKPLSAIMISSKGSRAMFGSRSYAVGDQPISGMSIQAIHSDRVILSDGDKEQTIELPLMGFNLEGNSISESSTDATQNTQISEDIPSEIQ